MKLASLTLVVLAGCGAHPAPDAAKGAPTAPVAAPPTLAAGPSEYTDGPPALHATGLPAVSADGAQVAVVVPISANVQGAGAKLVILDRADHAVREVVVQVPGANQPLTLADANQLLATTHATARWAPLPAAVVLHSTKGEVRPTAIVAGNVTLTGPNPVTVAIDGAKVFDHATPQWEAEKAASEPGCGNPSYLGGAALDPAHHLALVELHFEGSDSCIEPPNAFHVVAW
jgi:hypothetical protein